MAKFMLIVVAAAISVAVASPVELDDDFDWMKYAKEAGTKIANRLPEPKVKPIDWHNYGTGGFVNEDNNKFVVKTDERTIDWNKYGNEGNLNVIGNNVANAANNFLPKPQEQQFDWNNLGNGGNLNNGGNNHANEWNANVNGDGHAQEEVNFTNCEASKQYKHSEGMEEWCLANCFHSPSFCPSSHCHCW